MRSQEICYEAQVERVGSLLQEIAQAYEDRDFPRLIELGNRLATDSVIAGALDVGPQAYGPQDDRGRGSGQAPAEAA